MKLETKQKEIERKEFEIRDKYYSQISDAIDEYFPKGNKNHGKALALSAIIFHAGMQTQKEISEIKQKVNLK